MLFDLPNTPRPEPDTPAGPLQPGLGARSGTLLVDGWFRGTWRITRHRDTAVLHIEPFAPLTDRDAIAAEGEALLRFAVEDAATRDIRFEVS